MADLKEKISAKNAENKEKVKKEKTPMTRKKKIIVYLAIIVGILVVTNPTIIPFMPKSITAPVQSFITGIFGNMNGVAEMVKLDWSALFQLVIMVIMMLLLRELVNWAMEK